jgi:hypothetical protein
MNTSWWKRVLKSKMPPVRRGGRSRSAGARPRVEELETRDLMFVSVNLVNGQLIVSGAADNGDHTIILDHTGLNNGSGKTLVSVDNGPFQSFADAGITAGISVNGGVGDSTVLIRATVKPTSFVGEGADNIVRLGKGGNMQAILAPVTLTHPASFGAIDLTLDDSNDPVAQDVTMGVSNGFGTVAGLAPATISYKASDVLNVDVRGGSGGGRTGGDAGSGRTVAERRYARPRAQRRGGCRKPVRRAFPGGVPNARTGTSDGDRHTTPCQPSFQEAVVDFFREQWHARGIP